MKSGKQTNRFSRSRIELFLNCPRCFYLEQTAGIKQPPGYPFTLNNAIDKLLKREFDYYRRLQLPHPVMQEHCLQMVPLHHPQMSTWTNAFKGVEVSLPHLGWTMFGGVDDVWVDTATIHDSFPTLTVVDYKATGSQPSSPNKLVYPEYKRQLGFYRWLLEQQGFPVHRTAFLLVAKAIIDRNEFEGRLDFDMFLLPVSTDTNWVLPAIEAAHATLQLPEAPPPGEQCAYCQYVDKRMAHGA